MRYVEIDARNYWWRTEDDKILLVYKNRARNKFVREWINTTFKKYIINAAEARKIQNIVLFNNTKIVPDWIKKALHNNHAIYHSAYYNRLPVEHWIDYLNTLPERPIKMSVPQVIEKVREWDEQKVKANSVGTVQKILKVGNLTWYQLLDRDALRYESRYMKHCVGRDGMVYADLVEKGVTQIYSLRDTNNIPHVTIEITDNELCQVKGNSNKPFKEKYREPVVIFLNTLSNVTIDVIDDLLDNSLYVQDGKAVLLDKIKIDFNKPISDRLCNALIQNNKLPNKVVLEPYSNIVLDKLDHDLDIECDSLEVKSIKNVKLKIKVRFLEIDDSMCCVTGKAKSVSIKDSELEYNITESSNVRMDFCKIKTKELVTNTFICSNSKIKGKVTIKPIDNNSFISNVEFDTLDIMSQFKVEIYDSTIKYLVYKGKFLVLSKTQVDKMKIHTDYLIVLDKDIVLDNVVTNTLEVQFCNPKIKNVKVKKVLLDKTNLTEADFGLNNKVSL